KESLHLFAHDEQRTDCLVGEGVGTDVGDLDDLVADRYNESGDELRQIFRRFGFGDEEADDLETKLQDGTILLLIDEARRLQRQSAGAGRVCWPSRRFGTVDQRSRSRQADARRRLRTGEEGVAVSAKFKTTNPATGQVLEEFPTASDEEISAVIDASDAAFQTWRTTDIRDRTEPIARAADLMDKHRPELADLLTLEMGKLRAEAEAEVELAAR